ncbi:unnamed protein product [Trichogramma brassicae]|uniref:Uncharacterized protein n=1 Tax=Trichogramma brassicae TaxID=86971 RepID=A0A6H5HYD3_9HYME|nr:unnamed protein product [Trichogramma brassicae]
MKLAEASRHARRTHLLNHSHVSSFDSGQVAVASASAHISRARQGKRNRAICARRRPVGLVFLKFFFPHSPAPSSSASRPISTAANASVDTCPLYVITRHPLPVSCLKLEFTRFLAPYVASTLVRPGRVPSVDLSLPPQGHRRRLSADAI